MKIIKNKTKKESELIDIVKRIQRESDDFILGGSLMLCLRGIDLNREIHDIDLIIQSESYSFPFYLFSRCSVEPFDTEYPGHKLLEQIFINYSIKIDILYNPYLEIINKIDGIRCSSVKDLIIAKESYIEHRVKNNKIGMYNKHYMDLNILKQIT